MKKTTVRKAVIDLGTNTFHLLIADFEGDGKWREVYRERQYVYLASAGIGEINEQSFSKGIQTLTYFKEVMETYNVKEFKAIGTAALRSAKNTSTFIQQAKEVTDIEIEVIDGNTEASYISTGVQLAIGKELSEYLIMDIGGGSVEFILRKKDNISWQESFPLGLAVLKAQDDFTDPLSSASIRAYNELILRELSPLTELGEVKNPLPLVGASGTFDALLNLISSSDVGRMSQKIEKQDFEDAYRSIMPLTYDERMAHPGIPGERAELFPLALLLINTLLTELDIFSIYVSPYALKEGVLENMK